MVILSKITLLLQEPCASTNEIGSVCINPPISSTGSVRRMNSLTHERRLNSLSRADESVVRNRASTTTGGSDNNVSFL